VTIFGIIVVVLFLILGGLVIFSRMFDYIPKSYRVIFGTLIILYGAFRLVLLYNKSRNEE
jgi:uncharacterized membrane protein